MAPYQTHPHCSSKGPKVNMAPYYQKPLLFSDITPILGGKVLSGMKKTWEDIALSETRLNLIAKLQERKLGFQEVEKFSLGLQYSLRSEKYQDKNKNKKLTVKIVQAAMKVKMKDEMVNNKELNRKREKMRRKLAETYHPRSEKFKKIMRFLRQEAARMKSRQRKKYW